MKSTYSITEAQAKLPSILREAEGTPVTITRHDNAVAYVISKKRMDAITETLELLANPDAMKTLRASQAGHVKYTPLNEIEQD